ncbi:DUF3237 domain-containing protein [Ideonella sp. 4Y11]|uniref:UPF0311 protein KAK06_22300 n=1 Tax=Ideonella aquatica TaxID=2824119 RepID=A0A940YRR7_9BURK|nr:DUF3237 domain-containing protein [Ideonella aquatica]MBQ0961687.1 DUF3237 domain-containing protein [Ideonella aquatica]
MTDAFSPPPALQPMCRVVCEVGELVSLGGPAKHGERRYVPLLGGTVEGPELSGEILPGGVDWQVLRADGVLEIAAHYVIRTPDGALVEVQSDGLRHGPADVMARLARGEPVAASEYFFRTVVRFTTGAPAWAHLNRCLALAVGERQARAVRLDFHRIT